MLAFQITRGILSEEQQQQPSSKKRKLQLNDTLSDTSSGVGESSSTETISTRTTPSLDVTFSAPCSSGSISPSFSLTSPCDPSTPSDATLGSNIPFLLVTTDPPGECRKCVNLTRKKHTLQKKYNRLQRWYAKLENKLKTIQNEQVSFWIMIVIFLIFCNLIKMWVIVLKVCPFK